MSSPRPKVLRISPDPLAPEQESTELRRLFRRDVEIIEYPVNGLQDVDSVAAYARQHGVDAVVATHYRNRGQLASELEPTPLLGNLKCDQPTRDRFGYVTMQQVWDGLGRINERGEIARLEDRSLGK